MGLDRTGENVKIFPCPRCECDLDLNDMSCCHCGYSLPLEDEELGLEEFQEKVTQIL